ncbi:hypothetical protein ID866_4935 [Astraeus odoratus]|nr:hypothetical protein ID866_4935 [Astraeus odoratus]
MPGSKRVQRSPPSISYPIPAERAPLPSSSLASPPTTPPRGHKPSLSKPMSWLSRSATATSLPHPPRQQASKPVRISEPKFDNSLEIFNIKRGGPLGSGAVVVRTPQEALCGSQVSQLFGSVQEEDEQRDTALPLDDAEDDDPRILPPLPDSPPLPPLPCKTEDSQSIDGSGPASNSSLSLPLRQLPLPCPVRPPPPAPCTAQRPLLKPRRTSTDSSAPVPAVPDHITRTPPQPPFEAVLLSAVPDGAIDPAKIIVTLETCTTTYRTTLRTLISRPSHLSTYIHSLLSHGSETASVYSHASDASEIQQGSPFNAVLRDHLTSARCLSQSSSNLHIFLDRPSAPYAHILTYLRSVLPSPENPGVLPRAALLGSGSRARMETLLELRDEASYLGMEELYKLCCDQLNQRHSVLSQSRDVSSSALSVRSLQTVIEQCTPSEEVCSFRRSTDTTRSSTVAESTVAPPVVPCQSSLQERSASKTRMEVHVGRKTPPLGWI